jgi:hypothetical protein
MTVTAEFAIAVVGIVLYVILFWTMKTKVATRPAHGVQSASRHSGYQFNSRKERVSGDQRAHLSDFRNGKQLTNERSRYA